MPLFFFDCPDCKQSHELLVAASESPVCPGCGGEHLIKTLSRSSPPGRSKDIAKAARAQAAREGHLSNFGSR